MRSLATSRFWKLHNALPEEIRGLSDKTYKLWLAAPRHRFQAAFDAFCARWNLYGMQGDKPLTLKLSVNLTPHGTMIFIPAYWSFDAKRDMRWGAVKKLHSARALKKQGEGLA